MSPREGAIAAVCVCLCLAPGVGRWMAVPWVPTHQVVDDSRWTPGPCRAQFFTPGREGEPYIDPAELARSDGERVVLRKAEGARAVAQRSCRRLNRPDIRARLSCPGPSGWQVVLDGEENLCVTP